MPIPCPHGFPKASFCLTCKPQLDATYFDNYNRGLNNLPQFIPYNLSNDFEAIQSAHCGYQKGLDEVRFNKQFLNDNDD